jgi:hypothetical protein
MHSLTLIAINISMLLLSQFWSLLFRKKWFYNTNQELLQWKHNLRAELHKCWPSVAVRDIPKTAGSTHGNRCCRRTRAEIYLGKRVCFWIVKVDVSMLRDATSKVCRPVCNIFRFTGTHPSSFSRTAILMWHVCVIRRPVDQRAVSEYQYKSRRVIILVKSWTKTTSKIWPTYRKDQSKGKQQELCFPTHYHRSHDFIVGSFETRATVWTISYQWKDNVTCAFEQLDDWNLPDGPSHGTNKTLE